MKERLDGFERVLIRLATLNPAWIISAFIVAAQIILVIVLQSGASGLDTLDARAEFEMNSLRWLLLPGVITLYIKSAYYFLYLSLHATDTNFGAHITPLNKTLAVVIMLGIDTAVFLVIPALFNIPVLLAVFERGLAYYLLTAGVFSVFTAAFYWTRKNTFAFSILLLLAFIAAEFSVTWLSAELSRLAFFNGLYVWNIANPIMLSPVMALYLDAELVYEMLFLFAVTVVLSLLAVKFIYTPKRTSASPKQSG